MNRGRYFKVLQQIMAYPDTWDQKIWHCGTSHCFAGWAQKMAGKPESDEILAIFSNGETTSLWHVICTNREYVGTATRAFLDAMEWLELSQDDAAYVFHSQRTLPELIAFYENHPSANTDRESHSVTGTAPTEDSGTSCVGDHQPDLCGAGTKG